MASFLANLVAPVILGKPPKTISHLYVLTDNIEIIQPTGDFFYDRYIACPSSYRKEMYIIFMKGSYGGYEGINLNSLNTSKEFRSGAFDPRNAQLNGGHVKLLGCLEADGRLRTTMIENWKPKCDNEIDEEKKQQWEVAMKKWEEDTQTYLTREECDGELEVIEHLSFRERNDALGSFFDELPPDLVLPKCLQEFKELLFREGY